MTKAMTLSPREEWVIRRARASQGPLLDVGAARAGEGRPVIFERLLSGPARVIALDVNGPKLRRLGLPGSVAGDARRLPFRDGAFGCVLLCEVLEHVFEPVPLLREARRVLAPGGRLILTTPNPYQPGLWLRRWLFPRAVAERQNVRAFLGDEDHEAFWEPLSLLNLLRACGFEPEALTTKQHPVPFLKRFLPAFEGLDLPFFPFNRLGVYTCLTAINRPGALHPKLKNSARDSLRSSLAL